MSGISNYAKDIIANQIVYQASVPASVYVGLLLEEPHDYMTGSTVVEPPADVGYTRKPYTMAATHWTEASNGIVRSTQEIVFVSSAYAVWGDVIGWGIFTAVTTGELLYWGTFDEAKSVITGSTVSIPVEGMEISVMGPEG